MKYCLNFHKNKPQNSISNYRPLPNALNAYSKQDLTVIYHFLYPCMCCELCNTNSIQRMKKKCSKMLLYVIIMTPERCITITYTCHVCCRLYEKITQSEVKVLTIIDHFDIRRW